jgi:imidazoleglycerol-phosphate dehydratase
MVAVDLGGRSFLHYDLEFQAPKLGLLDAVQLQDFFLAFSRELKCNLHIHVPYGRNDHHKAEAVFKAWGKAMRMACSKDPRDIQDVPSTKNVF